WLYILFFFSSRRRHTRSKRDWSSDVCSSDLIIRDAIVPLDSEERKNVLIIDDSLFERNRSKKVELLAKTYDHANHRYRFGFRMQIGRASCRERVEVSGVGGAFRRQRDRIGKH